MNCKNCERSLRTDYLFCSHCGAKIIRNRLTLKNLWYDFTERYFNLDNTFLKTFTHLFTKPEVVIGGYIEGARKKYLNPVSYLILSIVLSGLMFFILKKGYQMTLLKSDMIGSDGTMDVVYDYQALVTYIGLPLYALVSYILFVDKAKFTIAEHVVINAYWMAQFSIVQFFVYVIVFGIFDWDFTVFGYYFLIAVVGYFLYIIKRLYGFSFKTIVLRGLVYFPMYFIAATISTIPIMIFLLITGDLNIQDFLSKK